MIQACKSINNNKVFAFIAARTVNPRRCFASESAVVGVDQESRNNFINEDKAELVQSTLYEALKFHESDHVPGGRPSGYFESLQHFRNGINPDLSGELMRQIAYQHFVTFRRPRLVLFAEQRNIFSDFFPKNERMIKAQIDLITSKGRLLKLAENCTPTELRDMPKFKVQVFHPEKVLYTIILLDGDKVRPDRRRRTEEILFMATNLSLSATSNSYVIKGEKEEEIKGKIILPYIPAHPTRGSGKHRLVSLLFEQREIEQNLQLKETKNIILDSNLSRETQIWELIKSKGWIPRGLNVSNMEWDNSVKSILEEFYNTHDPFYTIPPKAEIYSKARNIYRNLPMNNNN